METIKELLHYINPDTLAQGGLVVLWLVIFAETGLLVGFFLPGDSLLFTAGLLAATHPENFPVNIWVMVLVLISAAIMGDQVGYLFGRRVGPALFRREESLFFKPKYVQKTQAFYDRHGGKTIIIGRFMPFVRTFAPIIAGVARFDYRTFVIYNVTGGILWVGLMTLAGYFLGQSFPEIKDYLHYVLGGIILVSVLPVFFTAYKEWRLAKARKTGATKPGA